MVSSAPGTLAAPDLLAEVVRRIVEVARPERIILFGSAARGDAGRDSDLDFLVVTAAALRSESTGVSLVWRFPSTSSS